MEEIEIYQKGNKWQNNRYSFMANFNKTNGITSFGKAKKDGKRFYYHIIDLEKTVDIEDIIIEFTPSQDESIGDQSKFGGTDADIAIFYNDSESKKGVILIEFKYIENEFSICTSYKNKKYIRKVCDSITFHNDK